MNTGKFTKIHSLSKRQICAYLPLPPRGAWIETRANQEAIIRKANRLYEKVTSGKVSGILLHRCCDFQKLELALEQYKSEI